MIWVLAFLTVILILSVVHLSNKNACLTSRVDALWDSLGTGEQVGLLTGKYKLVTTLSPTDDALLENLPSFLEDAV